MSVSINNLFNYSRSLPVPFDTMTNKKVKVASMYGAKTESTLCGSVIKAVHAMCRCMNGTGEGAVGQIDTNKSVAEYKSSIGPDAYHLVVFDAASGSALASVYDKNTELIEQYVAHPSQRDGAAIFFALMPFLMSDAEFDETFQEYYDPSSLPDTRIWQRRPKAWQSSATMPIAESRTIPARRISISQWTSPET